MSSRISEKSGFRRLLPNATGNAVQYELHGPTTGAPDVLRDAQGSLQDITLAGYSDTVWTRHPGWFTSTGSNGTVERGPGLPSDVFFDASGWKSLAFWCWMIVEPGLEKFDLWSYGNPADFSATGGLGFNVLPSGDVRMQYNAGNDDLSIGRKSVRPISRGGARLVGGWVLRYDGLVYVQSLVDAHEQDLAGGEEGEWSTQPDTGLALFCRPNNNGIAANQVPDGVRVRDLNIIVSQGDLRFAFFRQLRRLQDRFGAVRSLQGDF